VIGKLMARKDRMGWNYVAMTGGLAASCDF
jgi:hypothetical protein